MHRRNGPGLPTFAARSGIFGPRWSDYPLQRWRFDEGKGLSTEQQQFDHTAVVNAVCDEVNRWRQRPNPTDWRVTAETARLLQYWRHHPFNDIRPFFYQVEAAETVIWLTEVAPQLGFSGDSGEIRRVMRRS